MNGHIFVLFFCLFRCAQVCGDDAAIGSLPGLDAESQAYIRKVETESQGYSKYNGYKTRTMLQFLGPFCHDMRPYEQDVSAKKYDDFRYGAMLSMSHILRPEWLPADWSEHHVRTVESGQREKDQSVFHEYWRVPKPVFPVFSRPGKAPAMFSALEIRKGSFSCTWLAESWLYRIIVLHDDKGFGILNPTPEQFAAIRDRYVRLPPKDLNLPKAWSSVFEVDVRDGRFCLGRVVGLVDGQNPIVTRENRTNTWLTSCGFFYDGFNLAFWMTNWSNGTAENHSEVAPKDIDWSKPPYDK